MNLQQLDYLYQNILPLLCDNQTNHSPEVGWSRIFSSNENIERILTYFIDPLNVLHWHGDRIILPRAATLLASSDRCKEQMFRIGDNIYGLQFHIEVEKVDVMRWIKEDSLFVETALGVGGGQLLYQQTQEFCEASNSDRLKLLRGLFEVLWLGL